MDDVGRTPVNRSLMCLGDGRPSVGIFGWELRAHSLPFRNPAVRFRLIADVDVDAGVQWLPDSAFAPPQSAAGSTASPRNRTRVPAPAPPRRGSASSSSSSVADRFKRRDRRRQQQQASPAEAGSPPALRRKGAGRSTPVPDDAVDDIIAGDGVDVAASDGHRGFSGNEIQARLGDQEGSVDPVTPSSPFPPPSRPPSGGVRPRPRRAVPFFGSGEWAAGGFPPHHAEASPLVGDADAARSKT